MLLQICLLPEKHDNLSQFAICGISKNITLNNKRIRHSYKFTFLGLSELEHIYERCDVTVLHRYTKDNEDMRK